MERKIYDEDHEAFRDVVKEFVKRYATEEKRKQWEADGEIDRATMLAAGESGIIGLSVPEEFGGAGMLQDYRFRSIVLACACDARGRQGHAEDDYPQGRYLLDALDILLTLDAGALARTVQREMAAPEAPARPLGACIRERLTAARVHLLTDQLPSPARPPAAG